MKIPTQQELAAQESKNTEALVEAAVLTIVGKMSPPVGGRRVVYASVPHELQQAVANRFAIAGWDLKFRDDQRDGASVELLPRRGQ